mgnify:CR=1 FL=1
MTKIGFVKIVNKKKDLKDEKIELVENRKEKNVGNDLTTVRIVWKSVQIDRDSTGKTVWNVEIIKNVVKDLAEKSDEKIEKNVEKRIVWNDKTIVEKRIVWSDEKIVEKIVWNDGRRIV